MKVLVSGSTGFVGSRLVELLQQRGCEVVRMTRSQKKSHAEPCISWDPKAKHIDMDALNQHQPDAVVHLAGESIAQGRWTDAKKQRIVQSRVEGTQFLAESIAKLTTPPKTFISGSAIGYYGDRGDEILDENSTGEHDFLATTCQAWEKATAPLQNTDIRVAHIRTGIVLNRNGGAIAMMLLPFVLGIGGILGNGKQYMSWIDLDDEVAAIHHILTHDSISGPVNLTAPNPVTNHEFTKTLGKVLGKPTIFPIPAFAVKLLFGEMGDALLLSSTRVIPKQLQDSGYQFMFPELEECLKHCLKHSF